MPRGKKDADAVEVAAESAQATPHVSLVQALTEALEHAKTLGGEAGKYIEAKLHKALAALAK